MSEASHLDWIDLNSTDPMIHVLSANVHRRHLSKGQLAIAIAGSRPGHQGKRGISSVPEPPALLLRARTVLRQLL